MFGVGLRPLHLSAPAGGRPSAGLEHTHTAEAAAAAVCCTHRHTDVLKRFVTKLNDLWQVICQFSSFDSSSGAAAPTHLPPLPLTPATPAPSQIVGIKTGSQNVFFYY